MCGTLGDEVDEDSYPENSDGATKDETESIFVGEKDRSENEVVEVLLAVAAGPSKLLKSTSRNVGEDMLCCWSGEG